MPKKRYRKLRRTASNTGDDKLDIFSDCVVNNCSWTEGCIYYCNRTWKRCLIFPFAVSIFLFLIVGGYYSSSQNLLKMSWLSCQGTIEQVEVNHRNHENFLGQEYQKGHRLIINYTYIVDGKQYSGQHYIDKDTSISASSLYKVRAYFITV